MSAGAEGGGTRLAGEVFLLLLAMLVVAVYLPSLQGPFALDDLPNIVENPSVRMSRLDLPSLGKAVLPDRSTDSHRPTAFFTFSLNYLLGRYDPFGYRLFNLFILLVSLPAAYLLALTVCRKWHEEGTADLLSMGATALWALHPLLTNGVSYIVQRMTSLCALFSLAALYCFIRGTDAGSRRWLAPSLLFWGLALASKEVAILLPLAALLYLWLAEPPESPRRRWFGWTLAAAVVLSQAALLLLFHDYPAWEIRPFSLGERLFTEGRVVLRYLSLFAAPLPSRLNLDYDFPLSTSLFSPPATAAALAVHCLLVAGALGAARRRPLLSFGVIAFYLLQLLESTVLPLEIIFEHRAYLPSFFLALALMDLLYLLAGKVTAERSAATALAAALAVSALWGLFTLQRNIVWSDPVVLARDIAAKSPEKPRALHNLGVVLSERGSYREALEHMQEAIRLDPANPEYHDAMGNILFQAGDMDRAALHFMEALRLSPGHAQAANNLGSLFFLKGDLEAAGRYYERSLQMEPDYAKANYNLGTLRAREGRLEEAIRLYAAALRSDPGSAEAHYNLGLALVRSGDPGGAADNFEAAVRLRPDHLEARYNLGVVLARRGETAAALEHFEGALRIDPDYGPARRALSEIVGQSRR